MDLEHALTLAQARSFVAALADAAVDDDASAVSESVLIELDWLHGDESPGLDSNGLSEDRDVLYLAATAAIEALALFGLDALDLELLLVRLDPAEPWTGSHVRRDRRPDADRARRPAAPAPDPAPDRRPLPSAAGAVHDREAAGIVIRQYRQTTLSWCAEAVMAAKPLVFSATLPAPANPFKMSNEPGTAVGELARALHLARDASTSPHATTALLTTPNPNEVVEHGRQAARAAALAEHDTNGAAGARLSSPRPRRSPVTSPRSPKHSSYSTSATSTSPAGKGSPNQAVSAGPPSRPHSTSALASPITASTTPAGVHAPTSCGSVRSEASWERSRPSTTCSCDSSRSRPP
jgi:hypothetical protein